MSAFVLAAATSPPTAREDDRRLEELAYETSRRALDLAGVSRGQLDHITIGACDELDGRPISSMLMAAPAGGFATDEIKVTDSGASALCLAYARLLSGDVQIGLVTSWCKSSKTDVETVMRLRGDPFFTRPLEIGGVESDALFAQAVSAEHHITEDEVGRRVVQAYGRAARNPRGMRYREPTLAEVNASSYEATPVRSAQRAPLTDGAVSMVLASDVFIRANRDCKPLARVAGAGWATDSYRIDGMRLRSMESARTAWQSALSQACLSGASDLDVIELECQTGYHEAAYVRAFGITDETVISPSGGAFAQNPLFCTGLVNAAEAVLQVSGTAGDVQRPNARWAAAHSCHGYAQQGNVVIVFEAVAG
jgi:acetyl-CoA acetyltransferase